MCQGFYILQKKEGGTVALIEQQRIFYQTLHSKNRNSFLVKLSKQEEKWNSRAIKDNQLRVKVSNYDEYISVNSFNSWKRTSTNLREIKAIIFDLDLHNEPFDIVADAIGNTLHLINGSVAYSKIPKPTLTINTGRGLQIFYILKDTIPCNLPTSKAPRFLFKATYELLQNRLLDILKEGLANRDGSDAKLLDLDSTSVNDLSRVVRIPGTYNTKANAYCQIVYFDDYIKYSLREIIDTYFIDEWETIQSGTLKSSKIKQATTNVEQKKTKDSGNLSKFRMEALRTLQALRNYDCEGHREYMCFLFYNHAKQINRTDYAFALLQQFNSNFLTPISYCELDAIRKSTDAVTNCVGEKGYYRLKNSWIINCLALTQVEQKALKIYKEKYTAQSIQRASEKSLSSAQKAQRDSDITRMVLENPHLRNKDIAEQFNISPSTLKRIYSRQGIVRTTGPKISCK